MSCFNTADWGIKNIYYHYGLLGNILSRYTPKVIVFEIHPCDYLDTPYSGTERAGSLAPFCGMSKECDEMLKLSGKYWPYKLSTVYRFTGSLPALIFGPWGGMDRLLKGWKPLDGQLDTTGLKAEEFPFPIHKQKLQLLEQSDTIDSLKLQPEFQINQGWINPKNGEKIRSRFYVGDFMYHDKILERVIVEDVKGMETPEFRLKWDLVRSQYPQYCFIKVTKDMI